MVGHEVLGHDLVGHQEVSPALQSKGVAGASVSYGDRGQRAGKQLLWKTAQGLASGGDGALKAAWRRSHLQGAALVISSPGKWDAMGCS